MIRKSLNISFEWSVLMKAQHVIDELQIMQAIFTQQITVMRDFEKALENIKESFRPIGFAGGDLNGLEIKMQEIKTALERTSDLIMNMEMRREELANLEQLQEKTRAQVEPHQARS